MRLRSFDDETLKNNSNFDVERIRYGSNSVNLKVLGRWVSDSGS